MAPRKLLFAKNGEQTPVNSVDESSDEEGPPDSNRGKALKKPKPAARAEPEENGSACSSPTTSGFIILPAVKPSGKKKTSKIFSDEEEIALLKGLELFWSNGRNNKWAEFHEFIKDDFGNRYSKIQVSEKIRSLRKKFERTRANGGRLDFSDPHESLVFQLSEVLWGDDTGVENGKSGGESSNKSRKLGQLDAPVEEENVAEKKKQKDGHGESRKRAVESREESKKIKQLDAPAEEENVAEKQNQEDEHGDIKKRAGESLKKSRKRGQLDAPAEAENGHGGSRKRAAESDRGQLDAPAEAENGHGGSRKRAAESDKKSRKRGQLDAPTEEENVAENGHGGSRKRAAESHKKSGKRKQLDAPEEEKIAEEEKQEDEHGESRKGAVESLKKSRTRKKLDAPAEEKIAEKEDEHGESRKRAVESHKKSRKRKQLDEEEKIAEEGKQEIGHGENGYMSKQGDEDEDAEGNHAPEKGKQVKEYDIEDFRSDFPLLYASFDKYEFPMIAKEKYVLIPREKAQELEEKWRELDADICRFELKRIELIKRDLEDRLRTR